MSERTALTDSEPTTPAAHDRAADESRVDRLLIDAKDISEDVAEWVRLKVHLIQIEVHERISEEVNTLLSSLLVLALLLIALLLTMLAAGIFVGDVLENDALGFLVVGVAIAVVAVILGRMQPQWVSTAMHILVPKRWLKVRKKRHEEAPDGERRG